jgi:mRNA interferase MazF
MNVNIKNKSSITYTGRMIKDFPGWHSLKQRLDSTIRPMTSTGYKERDIWWVSLGHNVGFEENGKGGKFSRPVLVVKGFSAEVFWGVPLTSKVKSGKFYYPFIISGLTVPSTALLTQLRIFDTKRMTTKIGMINEKDFKEIKRQLRVFIE